MPGAVSGVVGGLTGLYGADQSNKAAKAQEAAAREAAKLQQQQFEATRAALQPYQQAGAGALQRYQAALMGAQEAPIYEMQTTQEANPEYQNYIKEKQDIQNQISKLSKYGNRDLARQWEAKLYQLEQNKPQEFIEGQQQVQAGTYKPQEEFQRFMDNPATQFQIKQGLSALEQGAAARGGLLSGATLKATQRLGQDVASQQYQNYLNRLQGLSQSGQQAAGELGRFGQAASASQAAGLTDAAQQRAGGISGQYQQLGAGLGQLASGFGSYITNQNTQPANFNTAMGIPTI